MHRPGLLRAGIAALLREHRGGVQPAGAAGHRKAGRPAHPGHRAVARPDLAAESGPDRGAISPVGRVCGRPGRGGGDAALRLYVRPHREDDERRGPGRVRGRRARGDL